MLPITSRCGLNWDPRREIAGGAFADADKLVDHLISRIPREETPDIIAMQFSLAGLQPCTCNLAMGRVEANDAKVKCEIAVSHDPS